MFYYNSGKLAELNHQSEQRNILREKQILESTDFYPNRRKLKHFVFKRHQKKVTTSYCVTGLFQLLDNLEVLKNKTVHICMEKVKKKILA